jgi:hypothetical protein
VQESQEHVVAYNSRTLSKAKNKYCMTWQVLLAIVKTKEHFHKGPFVHWPHQPNQYLKGKTAQWFQCLQQYKSTQ